MEGRSYTSVGWKIREIDLSFKKDYHVMSPDQEEFDSIFSAFVYMANNRNVFKEEDVFKMKTKLSMEGFVEDEKLPAGWRIVRNRRENLFELMSREGVLYLTLNAAQEFMEGRDEYDDKHVLDMEDLCMGEVEAYLNNRVITNPGFGKFANGIAEASPEKMKIISKSDAKRGRKRKHAAY